MKATPANCTNNSGRFQPFFPSVDVYKRQLFTDSDELIDLAVDGIRLAVLMFPFVGAQIVIGNFFHCLLYTSRCV